MKIRSNYVSNSSSSSFIISYDPEAKEILKSKNGTEIIYSIKDFMDEMEYKYEVHSESTMLFEKGAKAIYDHAKEWWYDEDLKSLKEFLDKNPEHYKARLQIEYCDGRLKRYLLNLMKMGLVDVYADEYDLRDDC